MHPFCAVHRCSATTLALRRTNVVRSPLYVRLAPHLTGMGWLAGIGTAVTLFFGLPEMTLSEYVR